jgi:hypothetical protein
LIKTSPCIPFTLINELDMQRVTHTTRIGSNRPPSPLSLRRQGSNLSSGSGSRPGSASHHCSTAAADGGGASSSMRLESSEQPPNEVNPAVAEALNKVAEAMAVAEETAQKVDKLPSARLPTIVRFY